MSSFDIDRYIASGAVVSELAPALEQATITVASMVRAAAELDRLNIKAIRALAVGPDEAQEAHEGNLPYLHEVRFTQAPKYIASLRELADMLEGALPILEEVLDGWEPLTRRQN